MINLIAALSQQTRAIGRGGHLLWDLPGDLAHFKELTKGHPVIMGRKTWESIPEKWRPLPGRTNIIVTRDDSYSAPGGVVVMTIEVGIEVAKKSPGGEEIWIIGGGELYTLALPQADRLYLTLIDDEQEGDAYFPEWSGFTELERSEPHEEDGVHYQFVTFGRS
jgi:dihydrofolate reductase